MKKGSLAVAFLVVLSAVCLAGEDGRSAALKARQEKDREFGSSPTSPLAGAERRTCSPGTVAWLGGPNIISLGEKPAGAASFRIAGEGGGWAWSALPGVAERPRNVPAGPAQGPVTPGLEFPVGRQTVMAQLSGGSLVLIRFDPDREEIRSFRGLSYFPYDERYCVKGKFERCKNPAEIQLVTSRNLKKTFFRVGVIRFEWAGKPAALAAFAPSQDLAGAGELFVPFRDATTGAETYSAGRFLDLPVPAGDEIAVDFNAAYNPLCNYSDAYNCPRPPEENVLPFAVKAGEKTYGEGHGR